MDLDDLESIPTRVLLARAGRLLVAASPLGCATTVMTAVLQGMAPNVITLAGARIIGLAPRLDGSGPAREQAAVALAVLAGALLVERIAAAVAPVTTAYLIYRFGSALDRTRLVSGVSLPGLEHLESEALANRLAAASWSKSGPAGLLQRLITLIRRGTMLLGSLLILIGLAWWIPLVVCLPAVAIGINDWRHSGRRADLQRDAAQSLRYADYHRELAADATNAREVRLFALGDWLAERQRRFWTEGTAPVFASLRRQLRQNSLINVARGAALLVALGAALADLHDGSITVVIFTQSIFALRTASNGMYSLEGIPGGLRETIAFLPDVFAVQQLAERDPRLDTTGRVAPASVLADGIRFEGVVFGYPDRDGLVLDGLDLHIPAGRSLALVGENGAGKSTLVKLLCRFYDPIEGRITLDGVDLRDLDLTELRRRLAVVFQDFVKLPVSVRDNVAVAGLDPDTPDPDLLQEAAADAGAARLIEALPAGWDTPLSRQFGGVDPSGGQWQRLALARLLIASRTRRTPVLVLDEPTAALDVQVEADLYDHFKALTGDATTLLISHRFSTVRMADQVAVLERGRIVELGRHEELMTLDGRYAEMFALQASRFLPGPGAR